MVDGVDAVDTHRRRHGVWVWNAALLFCPRDGRYHAFGCECARRNSRLVPGALRAWYRQNWSAGPATGAGEGASGVGWGTADHGRFCRTG